MELVSHRTEDFGYLVIRNLYSSEELKCIWDEIFHLDHILDNKSLQVNSIDENTNTKQYHEDFAAGGKDGIQSFTGEGVVLDYLYHKREYSSILRINRKLFSSPITEVFSNIHPSNLPYSATTLDKTLLNRYEDSQGYSAHKDTASFSSITTLLHKPENIKGGDVHFVDYDVTFKNEHNRCVIFPSWVTHQADLIKSTNGAKRYSMSMFSYMTDYQSTKEE